jgi:signal-transduction protein with cAMP-binding, CBS, and nucleotidyltransferase domain
MARIMRLTWVRLPQLHATTPRNNPLTKISPQAYHPWPMEMTGRIGSLIGKKGGQVWSLESTASVYDAIAMMAEKGVGALPVIDGGKLLGIVSERDYARKVILKGKSSKETPVTEIMSFPVVSVSPSQTVEECMHIVTDKRIRHLPVTEGGRVVGMVSIGDLVNWLITEQRETIQHLEAYIAGSSGY